MITRMRKSHNQYLLAIDPAILDLIGIKPDQDIEVTTDGRRLLVQAAAQAAAQPCGAGPAQQPTGPNEGKGMSCIEACAAALRSAGRPMAIPELTKAIIEGGLWRTAGHTPENTVSAQILTHIKRLTSSGRKPLFNKVGPGRYALAD